MPVCCLETQKEGGPTGQAARYERARQALLQQSSWMEKRMLAAEDRERQKAKLFSVQCCSTHMLLESSFSIFFCSLL